jgi:hypothetical protein
MGRVNTRFACLGLVVVVRVASIGGCRRSTLPSALSDGELWDLSTNLSEPAGAFTISDNLVSNEPHFAEAVRRLAPKGGVYVGVGPEQNFSYIARLRPAMAFIVDIRRENLDLHLLYKALFEMSSDRSEFVSLLFSRPRPATLGPNATVDDIFRAFAKVRSSGEQHDRTAALVRERLTRIRKLPLLPPDLDWIERALQAFYEDGPEINYYGSRDVDAVRPAYRDLMTKQDLSGQYRSFLANEEGFRVVKQLHASNLIVPVVGDFAGRDAFRKIGQYVRSHNSRVWAVYGSNVGVYLTNQQTRTFCRNLALLPVPSNASFIDSRSVRSMNAKLNGCPSESKANDTPR